MKTESRNPTVTAPGWRVRLRRYAIVGCAGSIGVCVLFFILVAGSPSAADRRMTEDARGVETRIVQNAISTVAANMQTETADAPTATKTSTVTETPLPTKTYTATATPSASPTGSATPTTTVTLTTSATYSATATTKPSSTPKQTSSFTPTASATITNTPRPSATPTVTKTATPEPTKTLSPEQITDAALEAAFLTVEGVESVGIVRVIAADPIIVYSEIRVKEGFNNKETAAALQRKAFEYLVTASLEFSTILDDGKEAVDYMWDNRDDEWHENPLGMTAGSRAITASFTCPKNCDGAVAAGLSAAQAATCPGLDRDHDGVACYGD